MRKATMLKTFAAVVVAVSSVGCSLAAGSSASTARCLDGRQAALKAGGFSGPLLCDGPRASFKLAGTIRGTKQSYLAYDYRYQFMPEGGNVLHGGQRVLVLTSEGRYVGQYALTPPPPLDVAVNDVAIVISIGGDPKGTIEFKDGPPPEAFVDGDKLTFFK
ncbi:hypothetical protein [Roseateles sp.]|uniref:hypothetical protein n=1 Tax=Roseateles sp. TaxID=1971397 RepID=UPI0039EBF1EC